MGSAKSGPERIYEPGTKFGKWTFLERLGYQGGRNSRWRCRCDCGNVRDVIASNVINGGSTQCASCAGREKMAKRRKK